MDKHRTFGGIEPQYADRESAQILLQSVPYDGTSTWGKGADRGFLEFLEAAENMELYDIETDSEVYTRGICLIPELAVQSSPEAMYHAIVENTRSLLESNKFLTFIGGEHSISIGIIEAFREKYPDLSVLQLDAHADLRESYLGSPYNHACAMHQASKTGKLVQVGIRSMDSSEKAFLDENKCFYAHELDESGSWMDEAIAALGEHVYLSFDLDALDPSIFPATGTPEPGGLGWYQSLSFLKKVFKEKKVVGFDLVEFAPVEGLKAPGFLLAKLYYKLLSYQFEISHE